MFKINKIAQNCTFGVDFEFIISTKSQAVSYIMYIARTRNRYSLGISDNNIQFVELLWYYSKSIKI